ncbi:acyl-CoA dehydrogenase family protein [Rhodococcus rhodochrous]|uniref:acyl-CoA dehydrogenase family protein n=1 Tax=Rhodococcus rhodochrous TaxID=1829 RepID=UPI00188CEDE1|nr:acyl-CoA dehydrogenase family protein [Rhodococcus rhodochrous]MBF4476671.1 acyl-CoA/acyl-ACP dehydrogenase [Rhodococcus rhodochrous]
MTTELYESDLRKDLRTAVDNICADYPDEYWRTLDRDRLYPEKFVEALTQTGCLGALVPEEYGGLGLGMGDASVILEQINANGANAGPVHAQLYTMGALLRHGNDDQKKKYLPGIASGDIRLQAFAITEPTAGTDTTNISTSAVRDGDSYIINGQKVFISRVQHSDLMLLLARTTPKNEVSKKSDGLSVFLLDLRELKGITARPIRTMVNHETNEVFFDNVRVPAECLVGEEGKGFKHVLDGMNAERILVAAECIGDGRWFIERTRKYVGERVVFGRPIGANQGVQFPIARAHVNIEAANLMRWRASDLFDANLPCGNEANMAKLLASEASWEAANVALQSHGGYGMTEEYDIERKFRETRLYQIAPISTNLILSYVGQHVLEMPRSF